MKKDLMQKRKMLADGETSHDFSVELVGVPEVLLQDIKQEKQKAEVITVDMKN